MYDPLRPMHRFAAPIKGLAQRFAYLVLVTSAFALMMLGKADVVLVERVRVHITDAVAPILDVASQPIATVTHLIDQASALLDIRAENSRLKSEKARLLQWQAVARSLEAENASLRDILNFKVSRQAHYVTARVIADTGGAFAHSIILNAGLLDGVKEGQAAVTGEGLAGRIMGVGARSARVLLITDLNSRIPVWVGPNNIRAIMAGDNTNKPRLIYLPQGAVVSSGDRVVTSGHGGALAPRLPVGVVALVTDNGISVQPFVDRNRLEYIRAVNFGLVAPKTVDEASGKNNLP